MYDAREEGLARGRAEGREKDRIEAHLESARKMKENGVSVDLICTCTGLSIEEIEKLRLIS